MKDKKRKQTNFKPSLGMVHSAATHNNNYPDVEEVAVVDVVVVVTVHVHGMMWFDVEIGLAVVSFVPPVPLVDMNAK